MCRSAIAGASACRGTARHARGASTTHCGRHSLPRAPATQRAWHAAALRSVHDRDRSAARPVSQPARYPMRHDVPASPAHLPRHGARPLPPRPRARSVGVAHTVARHASARTAMRRASSTSARSERWMRTSLPSPLRRCRPRSAQRPTRCAVLQCGECAPRKTVCNLQRATCNVQLTRLATCNMQRTTCGGGGSGCPSGGCAAGGMAEGGGGE